MPVTFHPSKPPSPKTNNLLPTFTKSATSQSSKFLERVSDVSFFKSKGIYQSSLGSGVVPNNTIASRGDDGDLYASSNQPEPFVVTPSDHGFVRAVMLAYSHHHHLVLRPDDVWLAILTQLSFYITSHAEELRHLFVSHEGKKELKIQMAGNTPHDVAMEVFSAKMSDLMDENIKDKELRDWVLPNYSTTKEDDRIAATITMMSSLKEYFSFRMTVLCGLPKVTLLGEKRDWESLLGRIDKLGQFGEETKEWETVLRPVLTRFLKAFEGDPEGEWNKDFWNKVATKEFQGSGGDIWTGWITAFCFWDDEGRKLRTEHTLKPRESMRAITDEETGDIKSVQPYQEGPLEFDGIKFHTLDSERMPPGFCEVDLILEYGGKEVNGVLMAGSVGILVREDDDDALKGVNRTQPVTGWWLYEKRTKEEYEAAREARRF